MNARFHKPLQAYKDVLLELGSQKIIPLDFATDNATMADFRNMLIHAYPAISLEEVYDNLQKAPDIFRQFARYFNDAIA